MATTLRDIWDAVTAPLRHRRQRRMLRNRRLSIVANNCWAGFMYRYLGLPFNSPFVGLFLMAPDYVTLLENPHLLDGELEFIDRSQSRYAEVHAHLHPYPVARLAPDVEIHFLHYKSADEARDKWNRRRRRIDWSNAIVAMSECDGADEDLMRRFDRLPYPSKVLFTAVPRPEFKCSVCLPEYSARKRVGAAWRVCHRHYDIVAAANSLPGAIEL